MPEQDPIEQRIAEIEWRWRFRIYRTFAINEQQEFDWLIAQLREARAQVIRVSDDPPHRVNNPLTLEQRAAVQSEYSHWGTTISHNVLAWFIPRALADLERLEAALRKAEQERDAWQQTHKALLTRTSELQQERDEARRRLAWLAEYVVNVRTPLPHGSVDLFWYSPLVDEEGDPIEGPTLIERIDAAMSASKVEKPE